MGGVAGSFVDIGDYYWGNGVCVAVERVEFDG